LNETLTAYRQYHLTGAMGEFEVLKAMRDLHSDDRNADTEFLSEIETGRAVPAAPAEKGGLGIFEALW
jgi:hypothetical protein